MKEYQRKIKQEAISRGISRLYHFSPAENGANILRYGLLSREHLIDNEITFSPTDSIRLDRQYNAISLSIHSINRNMFESKKRKASTEWLIFELQASILWTHKCRFCWTNAASPEISKNTSFLGGPWGFQRMFENRPISPTDDRSFRDVYRRSENQPTEEGAEVQVYHPIAPELFVDVTVRTPRAKRELETLMEQLNQVKPVFVNEEVF